MVTSIFSFYPSQDKDPFFSRISKILNLLLLWGNNVILIIAFGYQFARHELPCPICLLQRVGIILISIGFFLNVRFGIRPSHYGVALVGCVITILIAMRQVFLHITPGNLGYGSSIFGVHFYSLAVLSSLLTIITIAFLLLGQNWEESRKLMPLNLLTRWEKIAIIVFAVLIVGNFFSTVLECELGKCVSDPIVYQLLNHHNFHP
ncbi:MAG: disulfide bond formation protein B [Candidatus Dasytiphilus stammeri]